IFIFGMTAEEAQSKAAQGYRPEDYAANNQNINKALARMYNGINGCTFEEVANSLKFKDPYMVLADFDAYQIAQQYVSECYKDRDKWNRMSLHNIAGAGIFSADRAVDEYARNIWKLSK
ncbi:MAG: glycogen/starch/alpha-glucan phosphorylase, partial [Oscillospiraceae bacterium]|nr:glycogen/starch/alpha-glucan phosphorylase [Oscillospiraceae bacterium]